MSEPNSQALRLEQALRFWEDACFRIRKYIPLLRARNHVVPCSAQGPVVNFPRFRKYLIENQERHFDTDSFLNPRNVVEYLAEVAWIPAGIFGWNFDSRRIFHLTHDLQTLLSATRLDLDSLDEIRLPFDSFAVTLADPIVNAQDDRFDCIVVSDAGKHLQGLKSGQFLFNLFSEKLGTLRPMGMIEKGQLMKAKGLDEKFVARSRRQLEEIGLNRKVIEYFFTNLRTPSAEPAASGAGLPFESILVESDEADAQWKEFRRLANEAHAEVGKSPLRTDEQDEFLRANVKEKAIHLVVSLCLYLSSLPPKEAAKLAWHKPPKISGQSDKVITRESQVCTVSCGHTLTAADHAVLNEISLTRKSFSMCVHWRRGFWRRARGFGHDPEAPRTVWVRPTMVNRDKCPETGLPVGSQTTLS